MLLNRDKLNSADPRLVGNATMAIVDVLQTYPTEVRTLAGAAFLKLLVEHRKMDPQDVMVAVGNLIDHANATFTPEFRAVGQYLADDFDGAR